MEKTFELKAIANRTLIINSCMVKPNKIFDIRISEHDFENIKPYVDIIEVEAVDDVQKSNSVIDENCINKNEKEKEVKENIKNDKPRTIANSRDKVSAKK